MDFLASCEPNATLYLFSSYMIFITALSTNITIKKLLSLSNGGKIFQMIFKDRTEAGQKLAQKLLPYKNQHPLILAIPRGGVPVGFEVAKLLRAVLDVLVVRKLGAPFNPEFGIGAITANLEILDKSSISYLGISNAEIEKIVERERKEVNRRIKKYRGNKSLPTITGQVVILVDDGLATGITVQVAAMTILNNNPKTLVIAAPLCSEDASERLRSLIRTQDCIICLQTPPDFSSVGAFYRDFPQVSDSQVISMLKS